MRPLIRGAAAMAAIFAAAMAVLALTQPALPTRTVSIPAIKADTNPAPQYTGKVLLHCGANPNQQVDPIVSYGEPISAHMHTPLGATGFSASETPDELLTADTSCPIASDHDQLWFPTPEQADGSNATLKMTAYYLANHGYDLTEEPPNGLRFVAGDSHYSGQFGHAEYICMSTRHASHTIPTTDECPPGPDGEGYEMLIQSDGQCWYPSDGLGEGMGPSTTKALITRDPQDTCLANGGQAIPLVILAIGVSADGIGGHLSSDPPDSPYPGSTLHFDFVYGFQPAADGPNATDDPIMLIQQACLNRTDLTQGQVGCIEASTTNHPLMGIYTTTAEHSGTLGTFVTN